MELNEDLISIQGIFTNVLKKTGEFTKISYTGGNEEKILAVIGELNKFLLSKNYINNNKINDAYETELKNIVLFLTINTSYKKTVNLDEFSHLTNIMPQVSKCLLGNIIFGLYLIKFYCYAIEKLPIDISAELFEEMTLCLRKAKPETNLEYSYCLLETAVNKLSSIEDLNKYEDSVDNLIQVTNIILLDLTGICSDQVRKMKKNQIYLHMGNTLLKLFDLLLLCNKDLPVLNKFINNILDTCCCIVQNVTINVFCSWAEVDIDEENLQIIIANKAYLVIEKYQKFKTASQLISMLSTIAKKPQSLNEQIYEADMEKIIYKINKKDHDQQQWFHALICTQVFKNKKAMECISKWSHLCKESDITRLLTLYHNEKEKNEYATQLILKCAANLTLESLLLTVTRHFHANSLGNPLNENITPQIMMIFNKLNENLDSEVLTKELTLLILQNPYLTLEYMYSECLKSTFYSISLKDVFREFKEVASIENIGLNVLNEVIAKNEPGTGSVKCYVEFFDMILASEHFTNEELLINVVFRVLDRNKNEEHLEVLRNMLQIFKDCKIQFSVRNEYKDLIKLLMDCILEYRCCFLDFCHIKQEVATLCVDLLVGKCSKTPTSNYKVECISQDDSYIVYYTKLLNSDPDNSIFSSVLSDFKESNFAENVTLMLKVLPSFVPYEWAVSFEELKSRIGWEKALEVFTYSLILICELVQARIQNNSVQDSEINCLKFSLQNFGLILQKASTIGEETTVAKCVCRILRKLPDILQEECFSLINIIPIESLKRLASDKDFVCLIALIRKPQICQILAQKMLS